MPEKYTEPVVKFNSTGMNPQSLADSVKDLIEQGYSFLFDHRGWKFFVKYASK